MGLTLVELMVAAALALLLIGVVWSMLRGVWRSTEQSLSRSGLQQGLAVALDSLAADLVDAHPAGVSLSADGSSLAVQPLGSLSSRGALGWKPELSIHALRSGSLVHRRLEAGDPALPGLTFPGTPVRLDPATLPDQGYSAERRLLSDVTVFRVGNVPSSLLPPLVGARLEMSLEARKPQPGNRPPIVVSLKRQFTFRNRGN